MFAGVVGIFQVSVHSDAAIKSAVNVDANAVQPARINHVAVDTKFADWGLAAVKGVFDFFAGARSASKQVFQDFRLGVLRFVVSRRAARVMVDLRLFWIVTPFVFLAVREQFFLNGHWLLQCVWSGIGVSGNPESLRRWYH